MTKPLTTRDLPHATQPGEVGVHVDSKGNVWLPIGLNPMSRYLDRTNLQIAHIQARRQWEDDRRAGARKTAGKVRVSLANCSWCKISIGIGYTQSELYIRPVLVKDHFEWKTVCGSCATWWHGLHFGFCVVSQRDWEDYAGNKRLIIRQWNKARIAKYERLESLEGDDIFGKWRVHELQAVRRWKHDHGTVHGYLDHRQLFLNSFITMQQPTVMTFSTLHGGAYSQQQEAA